MAFAIAFAMLPGCSCLCVCVCVYLHFEADFRLRLQIFSIDIMLHISVPNRFASKRLSLVFFSTYFFTNARTMFDAIPLYIVYTIYFRVFQFVGGLGAQIMPSVEWQQHTKDANDAEWFGVSGCDSGKCQLSTKSPSTSRSPTNFLLRTGKFENDLVVGISRASMGIHCYVW